MTKQITSGNCTVKYEYRLDRALVLFCNFNDQRLTQLADRLTKSSQVEQVTAINRYDEEMSSVVMVLKTGYKQWRMDAHIRTAVFRLK